MPEPVDTDEEQDDAIYERRWQRSLAPEEGEAHGMMNNEGDGDTKTEPMVLKNIQFQGSQPRTAAEAAKGSTILCGVEQMPLASKPNEA